MILFWLRHFYAEFGPHSLVDVVGYAYCWGDFAEVWYNPAVQSFYTFVTVYKSENKTTLFSIYIILTWVFCTDKKNFLFCFAWFYFNLPNWDTNFVYFPLRLPFFPSSLFPSFIFLSFILSFLHFYLLLPSKFFRWKI